MNSILACVLACPGCRATAGEGLSAEELVCRRCGLSFFELDGLPCVFPAGEAQRTLWNELLARFVELRDELLGSYEHVLRSTLLMPKSKERLEAKRSVQRATYDAIVETLEAIGLSANSSPEFERFTPKGFHQYYELMLRDWAWEPTETSEYRRYSDENALARQHALKHLAALGVKPERVLVIGAGAGRLSWDLHQALRPELTVALDSNPLLSGVCHQLAIAGATLSLPETRNMPHTGMPPFVEWSLSRPAGDPHPGFCVVAGDAFAMPFVPASFDLVVTPWFADICGKDFKRTLGLVDRALAPGGAWLHSGPFLYPDDLPEDQKYTPAELRQLLSLSKFEMVSESFETHPYTYSPLNQRGRLEEVWSFVAKAAPTKSHLNAAGESSERVFASALPPWLLLPHLAIPRQTQPDLFPPEVANIARLIDGTRSIEDLAMTLAASLPEGHDPLEFVLSFFQEYVVQDSPEH